MLVAWLSNLHNNIDFLPIEYKPNIEADFTWRQIGCIEVFRSITDCDVGKSCLTNILDPLSLARLKEMSANIAKLCCGSPYYIPS